MKLKSIPCLVAACLLAACASHDHGDTFLLGGATDQNIALQSVRDPGKPEPVPVESGLDGRAGDAVEALRKRPRGAAAGAGMGG